MHVLEVQTLCKRYPSFELKEVSFTLEKGKITGFIGRNGAGKSTTLNSLLHFVHPDQGVIRFFGKSIEESELEIKKRIGFVSSGVNYYPTKKIKKITAVTKTFYEQWDEKAYEYYMNMFHLDENKTPAQLSEGMKVKYALALALSHNAELLILDEPTSGLDPVSRDDLLDVFMDLCDKGKSILFSTHITSDLDKCAGNIIYIQNGQIIAEQNLNEFVHSYKVVELSKEKVDPRIAPLLIGKKRSKNGYSAIIKAEDANRIGIPSSEADLESIMIHMEKEEEK